jgi:hypothetical protein
MRRILYYSLLCLLWVSVNSCKDDEASQPPTPTFTVDRTSGMYNSTEFTFTVDQVGSNAVSLLPYGTDHVNDAGILIPASSFTNGKAVVKFVYGKVGTFNAVVLANNHTGDGLSVKNAISTPQAITITSNKTAITDFSFEGSTKTVIDTVAHTIVVTVPAGTDVTKLKGNFTAADFSAVTVGGAAQTSGTTVNDFTTPKTYNVKSQDNAKNQDWTVSVVVTPREKTNMFKSFSGINNKKGKLNGRVLPAYIDSAGNKVVVYDTIGSNPAKFDSVLLDYALKGSFAYAKFTATNKKLKGKDQVSLASPTQVTVVPQDSAAAAPDGPKTFDIYFKVAPRLTVTLTADSITDLNPVVKGTSSEWSINLDVLAPTKTNKLQTDFDFALPPSTTINSITVNGVAVNDGSVINYSEPVVFKVSVTQGTVTFWVSYTVTVTVVK